MELYYATTKTEESQSIMHLGWVFECNSQPYILSQRLFGPFWNGLGIMIMCLAKPARWS